MIRNGKNIVPVVVNGIILKRISDAKNAITVCAVLPDLLTWDQIVPEESE